MTRSAETLRERIARATWEQWRTLDIAAETCRDVPYDELLELAKAPPLERTGRNAAAQILEAALTQADAALAAIEASGHCIVPATGRRYRHKKRRTTYRLIGKAEVQGDAPLVEGDQAAVYVAERDGKLWARHEDEFNDGRFELIAAHPRDVATTEQSDE